MRCLNASRAPLLLAEWVLVELANGLCAVRTRWAAVAVAQRLRQEGRVTIIERSPALFRQGFDLFAARRDKAWLLTDCISFTIMKDHGITDALTGDHHFEQAGFVALLK